jgi:hypothetical protein
MGRATAASPNQQLTTEVACPHCDHPVEIAGPDRETEPKASPYVAALGDYTIENCPAGHKFWVYYC